MTDEKKEKIDQLTQKITEAIGKGRVITYKRGWEAPPLQSLTGWVYRGKNLLRVCTVNGIDGLASPYYCTYLQAQKYGGIKKGACGGSVRLCACALTEWDLLKESAPEEAKKTSKEEKARMQNTPVPGMSSAVGKYAVVFNASDLVSPPDFVTEWAQKLKLEDIEKSIDKEKIGRLYNILRSMPFPVKIGGSQPVSTGKGIIVPSLKFYRSIAMYVGDMLHEITHEIRCNRGYKKTWKYENNAPRYLEEMVAEIGSMFLANFLSLPFDNDREVMGIEYIRGWSSQRVKPLIDVAIKEAQNRTDYIIKILSEQGIISGSDVPAVAGDNN